MSSGSRAPFVALRVNDEDRHMAQAVSVDSEAFVCFVDSFLKNIRKNELCVCVRARALALVLALDSGSGGRWRQLWRKKPDMSRLLWQ